MDPTTMNVVTVQRAILWEEAKGKLRAIIATHGYGNERAGCKTSEDHEAVQKRYDDLKELIEGFIEQAEDEGLCE